MVGEPLAAKNSTEAAAFGRAMGQGNRAQSELVENVQEVEIVAQRFGTFHRQQNSHTAFVLRPLNIGEGFAEFEPRRLRQLLIEQGHLVESDL